MPPENHLSRQLLFLLFARDNDHISTSSLSDALEELVLAPSISISNWLVDRQKLSKQLAERILSLVEQRLLSGTEDATALFEGLSSLGNAVREIDGTLAATVNLSPELDDAKSQLTEAWKSIHYSLDQHLGKNRGTRETRSPWTEDRFRIIRQHAQGGLGVVFVAEDTQLRREVALKHIQHQFGDSQTLRDKFVFEAEVTGQLEHPCIVPVYALGTDSQGRPFYAMRFIRGDDLRKHIKAFHEGRKNRSTSADSKELRQLLRRFLDVCNAISYAHERGVLHRDLKPGNIMLGKFGETFVVDWGLAKANRNTSNETGNSKEREDGISQIRTSTDDSATQYGSFLGTAAYAPPEQLRGQLDLLDCRSDVYSLGAILFEVLTGEPPFNKAGSLPDLVKQIENSGAPSVRSQNPSIPKSLSAIADMALQAHMDRRYPTVSSMKTDVEAWLDDQPVSCVREGLADGISRWVRKHRGVAATAIASLFVITSVAIAGVVNYRMIAGKAELASDRATKEAIRANQANELNRQQLKEASRSELSVANSLIESSYSESDEKERRSRLGNKSNWHLGVGHLLNAIQLDPTNDIAKRRLYSSMVHQGRSRRDFPTEITAYYPKNMPVSSQSGTHIAYMVDDKTVEVILCESENNERREFVCKNPVTQFALLSDDATLLIREGENVSLWDINTSKLKTDVPSEVREQTKNEPVDSQLAGYELPKYSTRHQVNSATRDLVYQVGTRIFYRSFDDTTNAKPRLLSTRMANPSAVCVSPDGGRTAIGWHDGVLEIVKIIDHRTGTLSPVEIRSQGFYFSQLRFSSDGLRLASASDREVRVWNSVSADPMTGVLTHESTVKGLFFNRSGSKLFTIAAEKIYCWPIVSGGTTEAKLPHDGDVYSPNFSANSRYLTTNAHTAKNLAMNPTTHFSWDLKNLIPRNKSPLRGFYASPSVFWDLDSKFGITCSLSNAGTSWFVWDAQGQLLGQHIVAKRPHHREKAIWVPNRVDLIAIEGMPRTNRNSYELWDWRQNKMVWSTTQEFGEETLCCIEGDRIAVAFQRDGTEQLIVRKLSDQSLLYGPMAIKGNGELEAIQLLRNESAAICWRMIERKLTSGAPIQKFSLSRYELGSGEQIVPPLFIENFRSPINFATSIYSFFHSRLNRTFIYLDESQTLVDAGSLKLIPLELEFGHQSVKNANASADGELLVGSNITGGQCRVWSMEDGKLLGESEHNGTAHVSPNNSLISQITENQNLALFLDSRLKTQLEEPIESMPRGFISLESGAYDTSGELFVTPTKQGVSIREIPSEAMVAGVVKGQPSDLKWIESWIGLESKSDGGFRVLPTQEQLKQLAASKPNDPTWLELYDWLQSNSPSRPMTPRSRWLSHHVNKVAVSAGGELAKRVCLSEDPTLPNLRLMIAEEMDSTTKPANGDDVRMLANHLRAWDTRDFRTNSVDTNLQALTYLSRVPPQKIGTAEDSLAPNSIAKLTDILSHVLTSDANLDLDKMILIHQAIESVAIAADTDRTMLDRNSCLLLVSCLKQFQQRLHSLKEREERQIMELSHTISDLQVCVSLTPFCDLIRGKKWELAAKEIEFLIENGTDQPTVQLAKEILSAHRDLAEPTLVPSKIDAAIAEVMLSRCKPSSSKVGWGGPMFDCVPNPTVVLKAGHRPFASGIFAHAPAEYMYQLDAKWNRFQGSVAIQDYLRVGSVAFEIFGDGKSLWQSGLVQFNRRVDFDLDISSVRELKLVVNNGGDSNNSDWAVWLVPRLSR